MASPHLPAPQEFTFKRGEASSTMVASADSLPGAGSYNLQTCTGDPAVEANWKPHGSFQHCSKIMTNSYTPGVMAG